MDCFLFFLVNFYVSRLFQNWRFFFVITIDFYLRSLLFKEFIFLGRDYLTRILLVVLGHWDLIRRKFIILNLDKDWLRSQILIISQNRYNLRLKFFYDILFKLWLCRNFFIHKMDRHQLRIRFFIKNFDWDR